jgi:hypothetical protein
MSGEALHAPRERLTAETVAAHQVNHNVGS